MTIEGNITKGGSQFMLGRQATDMVACPTDRQLKTELNYQGFVVDSSKGFHRFLEIEDTTTHGGQAGGVVETASDILGTLVSFRGEDMLAANPVMTGDNQVGIQAVIKRGGKVTMEVVNAKLEVETEIEFTHKQ